MKSREGYTDIVLFKRLLAEARPYRRHIAATFVVSLLATPLALLTPVPLMVAVDSVIGTHPVPGFLDALLPAAVIGSDTALLAALAGMFVLIAVLTQVQAAGTTVLQTYTGERLVMLFRSKLFQHVQRLSLAYHDRIGTADSTYRIQYDAMAIQYVAVQSTIAFITAATTLVGMLYVTYRIDPQLALIALAVVPPILLSAKVFRPRMRGQSREVKKLESSALSVVQEVLTGLRVVKAFGQEDREHERFLGRAGEGMRARIRLALVEGAYSLLIGVTIGAGGAAVLFVGMRRVQSGAMTLGDLLLVMGYLAALYAPLKTMAKNAGSLQKNLASAERAFGILDETPEVPERPHARPLARASGAVQFAQVGFAYEADHPVLDDVSFAIEPGERVGIAGPTGAGKSTLMNLLTRFYDPTCGSILLDGVDLRDYRLADLRNQFGIVLQEPVLLSTSIEENIAYARPRASEGEIEAAARAANAHDFITDLPEGYATPVGERGMRLSGGERQRISLARAFLKDAPILILDEPTSSVDVKTEAVIMEAMERLMSGRTSFMIAHRLSTLDVCERRLQIERGRVAEVTPKRAPVTQPAALNGARSHSTPSALERHPAVRAWKRLEPGARPRDLRVLKERSKGIRKSAVYRLDGGGPGGSPIIAKLCRRAAAEVEHTVYRDVLPHLPVPALRCHGMLDEGGDFCWLFLDDAGTGLYSPLNKEHRRLAARWLAAAHTTGARTAAVSRLPDIGPSHYLAQLRSAREAIVANLDDRSLDAEEIAAFEVVISQLGVLESRWSEIDALCGTLPSTLVHGDFAQKNLRVRADDARAALLIFDWEGAGKGARAVDLAQLSDSEKFAANPCLDTYRSTVQNVGTDLSRETVEMLAAVGRIFRCIAGIRWTSLSLSPVWLRPPLADLRVYSRWLGEAMQAAGLEVPGHGPLEHSADSADDDVLLRSLEQQALPRICGKRSGGIVRLERTRSANTTSYDTDILTVHLTDGKEARLFRKDFGFTRAPKDGAKERRAREVHVYRDLLDGSGLGIPAYYGSVYDEGRGRFWLLLELVSGIELRSRDFDDWVRAAGWLGRLQGYVARTWGRIESSPLLVRHDRDFFALRAERALVDVADISPGAARRLLKILAGYDALIGLMAEQPLTLVHGNYRPRNILIDVASVPVRVCPVDWEVAGIGATLYDLALLADGYRSSQLELLFDAYRTEAIRHGVSVPDPRDMAHIANCFCLHRVIKSLSRAREKGFSEAQVSNLLAHGERLHRRLRTQTRVSGR